MRTRLEDIEQYFHTHGRLIAADIKYLIKKAKEAPQDESDTSIVRTGRRRTL